MEHIIQWQPGKSKTLSRSDADVKGDVVSVLRQFPQSEDGWAFGAPQTDEDVVALFCRLTLASQYPPESRKRMTSPDLIKELAKTLDQNRQLDTMVLLDACEVAVKQGGVRLEEARNLMRLTLDKTDTALDGMRWGVQKFIRMMDELHLHGVVGLRTYELAVRRRAANALSKVAKFTKRHMEILQGECQNIYQPRRSFDSTCLRVPNIVYVLFAGRFSRDAIEGGHRLHGQDALGERFTFRVDTFCIFISLDTAFREAQNMAGREVVSLAPLLQRPGLLGFFPKLLDCLKAKLSLVASVAESRGWRVVNMDHWKPQVFRLEPNATLPGSQGHLNAAVLLQECGMVILADHSGKELRWGPDQLLCYTGQSMHCRNERDRPFCLLIQLEVEEN